MGGRGASFGREGTGAFSVPELPDLTGSRKQIAWAEDIRRQKIETFTKYDEMLSEAIAKKDTRKIDAGHDILYHMAFPTFASGSEFRKARGEAMRPMEKAFESKSIEEQNRTYEQFRKKRSVANAIFSRQEYRKAFSKILKEKTSSSYWISYITG